MWVLLSDHSHVTESPTVILMEKSSAGALRPHAMANIVPCVAVVVVVVVAVVAEDPEVVDAGVVIVVGEVAVVVVVMVVDDEEGVDGANVLWLLTTVIVPIMMSKCTMQKKGNTPGSSNWCSYVALRRTPDENSPSGTLLKPLVTECGSRSSHSHITLSPAAMLMW